jgi:AhpC/TSA family
MIRTLRIPVWAAMAVLSVQLGAQSSGRLVRDVDGTARNLFQPAGKAGVLVFVSSDCPISNGYAPDVQEACAAYASKGVSCTLVYEDTQIDVAGVRAHQREYRYRGIPAVIDADRAVARRAKATVTPQAVVIDAKGLVRYRGRIDNKYATLGTTRRVVTVHDLNESVDAVLAGRPVLHPETEPLGCFIPLSPLPR